MTITVYPEVEQGSDEWLQLRCGLLTASNVKHILTAKKLDVVKNPAILYELLAQRISGFIEPQYINDDMVRGHIDEAEAKIIYAKKYNVEVENSGFVTNDKWGFKLGYSPDGLIGKDGSLEAKSRDQKFQVETIISDMLPDEFRIQVQTGLLVTEREWCDFISYSGGYPMMVKRIYPDKEIQEYIVAAATIFHEKLEEAELKYREIIEQRDYAMTERRKEMEEEGIVV